MKHIAALLLLLVIGNPCLAQNFNIGKAESSHYYLQLPYEQINGKIIIEIEIGGQKKKFFLDTGAPNQISDEIATDLDIKPTKQSEVVDAYGNTTMASIATVKAIKLGDVVFNNVPALIGIPAFFKCFGVEGIIGSNLLRNSIIQFNSVKKTIVITNDEARLVFNKQNGIALITKSDQQSSPIITVGVADETTGQFLFDTGEGGFLVVSNNYMNIFKAHNAFQTISTGFGANSFGELGAEKNEVKYRLKFPAIQICNTIFKNTITETALNNNNNGNRIGVKLLDYGIVTVDYLHRKFYLDPVKPENDLNEKTWPVSPMFSNGKLVVGIVWEKLKDTLKPGMQIVAIDDVPCPEIDICNLITEKPLLYGREHATITIKDDSGKLTKLEIDKE